MTDLPPSLLVRRGQRLHLVLVVSAGLHAALFGAALLASRAGADGQRLDPDMQTIAATLVRLGEERDPNLLPRKQASPPPPPPERAAPPSPPPEEPTPPPEPAESAVSVPSPDATPDPPEEPAPESPPPPRPSTSERSDPADLDDAIRRFIGDGDPDARPDDGTRYGSPDGHPDGWAESASEGDLYLGLVRRRLHENYQVPSIIPERERLFLNATVVIYVALDGRILRTEIERPSGNRHFDAALLRAVESSSPLPPPPPGWAQRFEREGLGINFRIQD